MRKSFAFLFFFFGCSPMVKDIDFVAEYTRSACDKVARCCSYGSNYEEECSLTPNAIVVQQKEAAEALGLKYDSEVAGECVSWLRSSPCSSSLGFSREETPCDAEKIWRGLLKDGDKCSSSAQCSRGLLCLCRERKCLVKACTPEKRQRQGEACYSEDYLPCEKGLT